MLASLVYNHYIETKQMKDKAMKTVAKVFSFAKVLEIANMPVNIKQAIVDQAYDDCFVEGMMLDAAVRLMDIPAAQRNIVYKVGTQSFEQIEVETVGKFVYVYGW